MLGTVRLPAQGTSVRFEELRHLCQEAASDLLEQRGRPLPPTVVLPRPERTRLVTIPEFPDDDEARHAVLAGLAHDEVAEPETPAWGFIVEAEVGGDDAAVVVYGARRHAPELTAARFDDQGGLGEFVPPEELDPTAMPFLHPLQHAVDSLPPMEAGDPGQGGLPLLDGHADH